MLYLLAMETSIPPKAIRLLPEEVSNQIAAGEVVERPASVLKELMENSLDAGAGRIGVEVAAGGRRLIRVVDDGVGMLPDDLLLSLERHATSKVAGVEDLTHIASLGFRGEALPSIAAVSRMSLRSRTRDAEAGGLVRVEGGRVTSVEEVGCPVGTLVEVKDLFFNTPARRKFLKSQATESGHLAGALVRLALAQPQVAFRYTVGSQVTYDLPAGQDLASRAGSLLGRATAEAMVRLHEEEGPLRLEGLAGLPSLNRSAADQIYTFVNGRFVRDKVLLHAIYQAYRGLMPDNRRPVVVLHLSLDPELVDVNVHPAKTEVRFTQQQQVHQALAGALRRGLGRSRTLRPTPQPSAGGPPPARPQPMAERGPWTPPRSVSPSPGGRVAEPSPQGGPREPAVLPAGSANRLRPMYTKAEELVVIGQLHGLYVLCSSPQGLILVDQHAAHERLTYERLKAGLAHGEMPRQGLLTPQTLELTPGEAAWAGEQAGQWARLGLELEPFGGNTWAIRAVPPHLAGGDPRPAVRDLLSQMSASGLPVETPEFVETALRSLACHGSVRQGQRLKPAELEELVDQICTLPPPLTCPHGRPVMLLLSRHELDRSFKRGSEPS
ncbi:MAG: DNA mismatch repair endonuclease MutL [Desulfarculaceae bacterium]|nr:DNA mismatch repair endonuclease MutL [Desulfarculaceae bacterium]MCF8048784.1 DNA mismatch repair endonuclease MutL [Desulfarculaceae bacterium]MCF8065756.1 DNA mismatch repair endonuclease MutL [Desulfarculaceae bacterium]MCF8096959.1 DNA mismatch repair endonuclease MutL [Desulfarculaceae bacterium]MCF8122653.1 DNA mismatch repair endonuclease MutL [Desulfarculaceae bacterium]